MRFIGNKTKLLTYINDILVTNNALPGNHFFDFFAGTASVGKYFKEKGFVVSSSDILYFSYVLQRAYIGYTGKPGFTELTRALPEISRDKLFNSNYELVIDYLNTIPGEEGFIYRNYTEEGTKDSDQIRKFFIGNNGKKIDAIRHTIEEWHLNAYINEDEYYILVATLIETVPFYANISGVYAAFLKSYDPRAKKDLVLRPLVLSSAGPIGEAFNLNSMNIIEDIDTDILYLDPPYNARQYAPNYHLLETIARYDDPVIKGVAGIRAYSDQKSEFCNKNTALLALDEIAKTAKYNVLALSYNTEGIMDQQDILSTLSKYGNAMVHEVEYRRFKSNSRGNVEAKTHIKEQVYILKRF
jgi:adenine-specific DNA-methyltransferase